jgi:hypothetical protein
LISLIELEKPSLHELSHVGVLGMHWGHREPEEVSTKSNKKQYTIPDKKTAHRVRLEAKYLKKGVSNEQAEQMAAKRIRGEKIALGILGAAVAAGAAYAAYQALGKRYSSVVLEAGQEIHNINALGDKNDYNRRIYGTFQKGDTAKYKGLLATALRKNAKDTTIYDTVLKTTETIKAPSHKEAQNLFKECFKNAVDKKAYVPFNASFANDFNNPKQQQFVNFLKTKGYNAILDSNDQFVSGYNTKKPIILFNAASSTVKAGQTIVDEMTTKRLNRIQMTTIISKQVAPTVGLGLAAIGGSHAIDTNNKYGACNSFFKKNPQLKYPYGAVFNALEKKAVKGEVVYVVNTAKLKGA